MSHMNHFMTQLPSDLDAALITSGVNRAYFTRFSSSAGILVITKDKAYFLIDFRYIEVAKRTIKGAEVTLLTDKKAQLNEIFAKHGVKKIAVEADYMTVSELDAYKAEFESVEFCSDGRMDQIIHDLRMIKDEYELSCIQAAQKITDTAFANICNFIKAGMTEREVATQLAYEMKKNGSENEAFSIICVSGKNSSLPHGVPTDKVIESGDFLTMDFGAKFGGYCSDMTRTVAIGEISEEQHKVYHTVLKAQLAALDQIKSGLKCSSIDKVARDIIYQAGYEGCFGHGLGHSLGIEIHEAPRFAMNCDVLTQPGMIITVEPGIYLENQFGVRIEDMAYITQDGHINLTHSPKELITIK